VKVAKKDVKNEGVGVGRCLDALCESGREDNVCEWGSCDLLGLEV
jgi:hypothetical protein